MYDHDAPYGRRGTAAAVEPKPRGFGIRFAARLIDAGVGLILGYAGGFVGGILLALTRGPDAVAASQHVLGSPRLIETSAVSLVVSTCAASAYHVAAEWLGGATIGKLFLGLRVRSAKLGPCSFGGALIRTVAYYIDALLFGLVAYLVMQDSPMKQRLGDKWGNTVVVEVYSLPRNADDTVRVIVGVLVGSSLWVAIAASQVLIQTAILAGPLREGTVWS